MVQKPPSGWKCGLQVMSPEECEKLTVQFSDLARLPAVLQEHGCAIVTGVVPNHTEIKAFEKDFKKDLTDLVDVDALKQAPEVVQAAFERFSSEGPRSFPLRTTTQELTVAAGFCVTRCLQHGRFAWRARRHPKVHEVYRTIFDGCENLVTSLDVTFFTPGGQESSDTNRCSAHCDQNTHDVRDGVGENTSYQGVLYIWPATADGHASTTALWPGSHKTVWPRLMEDDVFKILGRKGYHYCELQAMMDKNCAWKLAQEWQRCARRAVVPAGSLLLWNSRLIHTGWIGGPRLAQTVCLEPADRRSEAARVAKLRLAALGLPSTHWASSAMQHDLSLYYPGVFAQDTVEAAQGETDDYDQVVLPLRPALRPAACRGAVSLESLKEFVNVDYELVGMWNPPEGAGAVLNAVLRDEYKRYL